MIRPCFLVIDREHASSISTRKLVIETAKLNVITSYSAQEAVETLRRFPGVDGVVMDTHLRDSSCDLLCRQLRGIVPGLVIVAISGPRVDGCMEADHVLESFEPAKLLDLLKRLTPKAAEAIEAREEQLVARQGLEKPGVDD